MGAIIAEESFTNFLEVARGYAVADKVKDDVWKGMLRVAQKIKDSGGSVVDALLEAEKDYKKTTGATSMPGPWRSAKSILVKMILNGTDLITKDPDTGEEKFTGKTKAQRKVKTVAQQMRDIKEALNSLCKCVTSEEWDNFRLEVSDLFVNMRTLTK